MTWIPMWRFFRNPREQGRPCKENVCINSDDQRDIYFKISIFVGMKQGKCIVQFWWLVSYQISRQTPHPPLATFPWPVFGYQAAKETEVGMPDPLMSLEAVPLASDVVVVTHIIFFSSTTNDSIFNLKQNVTLKKNDKKKVKWEVHPKILMNLLLGNTQLLLPELGTTRIYKLATMDRKSRRLPNRKFFGKGGRGGWVSGSPLVLDLCWMVGLDIFWEKWEMRVGRYWVVPRSLW